MVLGRLLQVVFSGFRLVFDTIVANKDTFHIVLGRKKAEQALTKTKKVEF